jgi:hypothetical protein
MKINISIDGVLRNTIQKLEYIYSNELVDSETIPQQIIEIDEYDNEKIIETEVNNIEYQISKPIFNDNILNSFVFNSKEEYENFVYLEYPLEIFGHANISYQNAFNDLNSFILNHKEDEITLIGLDELGKAKPATLFFLAKNGCLVNNIKFIKSTDIEKEWRKCDMWITDNFSIIESKTNKRKKAILFSTEYNSNHNNYKNKTNKIC